MCLLALFFFASWLAAPQRVLVLCLPAWDRGSIVGQPGVLCQAGHYADLAARLAYLEQFSGKERERHVRLYRLLGFHGIEQSEFHSPVGGGSSERPLRPTG